MTARTPALDTDALSTLYAPFLPPSAFAGWSYSNSGDSAILFVSQGGEYILNEPAQTVSTGPVSGDAATSIANLCAAVAAGLDAGSSGLAAQIRSWAGQVAAGGDVQQLSVTTRVTCYNQLSGDDKADLELLFVYCDPLDQMLLIWHSVSIDWAGTLQGSTTAFFFSEALLDELSDGSKVIALGKLTGKLLDWGMAAGEAVPGLDVVSSICLGAKIVDVVAKLALTAKEQGQRAYLIAVVAQAIVRISSCVSPRSYPASQLPQLDSSQLDVSWTNCTMTVHEPEFGTTEADFQMGAWFQLSPQTFYVLDDNPRTTQTTLPFQVWMPELSWSGGSTPWGMATWKVYVDDDDKMVAICFVIWTPAGAIFSSVLQLLTHTNLQLLTTADPWFYANGDCLTPSGSIYADEIQWIYKDIACSVGCSQYAIVLPAMFSQWIGAISLRDLPAVQPQAVGSVSLNTATKVDTDKTSSSIAVRPDGDALICYDDRGAINISHVYYRYGSFGPSDTEIQWGDPVKYGSASWPSVSANPGGYTQSFIEVHNYSNNIYFQTGIVDGSSVKLDDAYDDDSKIISPEDHPSVFMSGNGLTLVVTSNNTNDLLYNCAYYDGFGSWQPRAEAIAIDWSGDYPTAVLFQDTDTVVMVYQGSGKLLYNFGQISSSDRYGSITWASGPFPLGLDGGHPHLAIWDDGTLMLLYDSSERLYAAIGRVINARPRWFITNIYLGSGQCGSVFAVNKHQVPYTFAMSYTISGTVYSVIGSLVLPTP